ncbi:hypothetical protein LBMAG52_37410 [Planctomycetia bacterium]|nr:hypothetical protein LBMAG52_37410 [Planctomycetia bacterium]
MGRLLRTGWLPRDNVFGRDSGASDKKSGTNKRSAAFTADTCGGF